MIYKAQRTLDFQWGAVNAPSRGVIYLNPQANVQMQPIH